MLGRSSERFCQPSLRLGVRRVELEAFAYEVPRLFEVARLHRGAGLLDPLLDEEVLLLLRDRGRPGRLLAHAAALARRGRSRLAAGRGRRGLPARRRGGFAARGRSRFDPAPAASHDGDGETEDEQSEDDAVHPVLQAVRSFRARVQGTGERSRDLAPGSPCPVEPWNAGLIGGPCHVPVTLWGAIPGAAGGPGRAGKGGGRRTIGTVPPSLPPSPSHPRDEALLYLEWARGAAGAMLPADPHEGTGARAEAAVPVARPLERLAALALEVSGCRRCGLCRGRTQTVFGEGSATPRLVVVGEAPGAEEDRTGRPFVGAAGQLLTRMLAAIGLAREDVFIANVLKCRPPENRSPRPDEVAACRPYLKEQLTLLGPPLVLVLGNHAAKALLATERGISSLRGRFTTTPEGWRVMPTFHPAYLLRNPDAKREVWEDLKKVAADVGLRAPQQVRAQDPKAAPPAKA